MADNAARAHEIVETALQELRSIADRGFDVRFNVDLERWKRRVVEDLRTFVSPEEARSFEKIRLRPNWVTMEDVVRIVERHAAALQSLKTDLERFPGRILPEGTEPAELPGRPRLFLSHAAADSVLAQHIEAGIIKSRPDIEVFRTSRVGQIPAGRPWFDHVMKHLSGSKRYVVLLTPTSQLRPWVTFEAGAAWMTQRTVVFVLGAGLTPAAVVEPLKHLQVLSLENSEEVTEAFRELGADIDDAELFAERAKALGRECATTALQELDWQLAEYEEKRYVWDGPVEELKDGAPVPLPEGLLECLKTHGLRLTTAEPRDLLKPYSKGYKQVWFVDNRMYKHAVVSKDLQVLMAKPERST